MKTIALIGNPNVGKTTLFNKLTGSKQRVGNWAGVTVDKKEGFLGDVKIVDLPGIYAMDTFSHEEKVSKNFLQGDEVDLILNIIDASNMSRNLYLTTQLKQFNKPMLLVVNMLDVARDKGFEYDLKTLSKELNAQIIPIVASKDEGIEDLKSILTGDLSHLTVDEKDYIFNDEKEAYQYIDNIINKCNKNSKESKKNFKDKLDNVFLHPILAYPLFVLIMFLMFQITFTWVGQPLSDLLDAFLNDSLIPGLADMLSGSSPWFQSLIVDGIVAGVGGVIVLLPIILTLFTCITILEDSGYMARVAFIMDKLMRKMGLTGKAFIPMIVGFGCTVPAIMSARTLESEKDRKLTALLVPLMSCGARLPVYAVFASVFFPKNASIVVTGLYFLGIILAFLLGILFKKTIFKNEEEPFIIEIPEYKTPNFTNLVKQVYDKGKGFIIKAGTIIFAMSVVLWVLSNFNFTGMVDMDDSLLASIGNILSPIFTPLGFGNWQSSVSLLTGLLAKESVVASMGVVYAGDLSIMLPLYFNAASALSFMVFVLLYTPCVSVIGVMKKEFGSKLMWFSIAYQITLAWVVSFIVYHIALLFL
ncbi:MAG: ferrous iron transport protein B [Clostridium sp.]